MGMLAILLLFQLALSIAGGALLARKGIWFAIGSVIVLPAVMVVVVTALALVGEYQAESWARALPFVAAGAVVQWVIGAIGALAAYKIRK